MLQKQKKRFFYMGILFIGVLIGLSVRCFYVSVFQSGYLSDKAKDVQERERTILATRGRILDRNGIVLADNETVADISVIHNQISETEKVIEVLSEKLGMAPEVVRKKVEKLSAREWIKKNVAEEIGKELNELHLEGVVVDFSKRRIYPYHTLASKVLGFTGGDNQGVIGIECVYDKVLTGENGKVLTITDAKGIEVVEKKVTRIEPVKGKDLQTSLDANIQMYATQLAKAAYLKKEAESVSILVMEVKTGEMLAMVNFPEFDCNHPYEFTQYWAEKVQKKQAEIVKQADVETQETETREEGTPELSETQKNEWLNAMWRNGCINDTYEPGSTFKIITASAALEEKVVSLDSSFYCPGYIVVGDRRIRCHKTAGHGSESFVQATMNSCNPVFITLGLRLGVDRFYEYFERFGLMQKTGIDLPGEARTIMHKKENCKEVELATCSFGQSFQITPINLLTTVAALINGGKRVTPHVGVYALGQDGEVAETFTYKTTEGLIQEDTSEKLCGILEKVVSEGSGSNGAVEGFLIGGKTATSQTIPRGNGIYIASYIGFAPATDPEVITLAIVHSPKGTYYGGQVAAPIVRQLYENILPYLDIEKNVTE